MTDLSSFASSRLCVRKNNVSRKVAGTQRRQVGGVKSIPTLRNEKARSATTERGWPYRPDGTLIDLVEFILVELRIRPKLS